MSFLLDVALPALLVVAIWWTSTAIIFALNGLPEKTYAWSILGASGLAAAAVAAVGLTAAGAGRSDAVIAFAGAIVIWGLIEMTFLMGFVTGPRPLPCPVNASSWARFFAACQAIAYHEAAIVVAMCALFWLTASMSNAVGPTTFALLWLMRLSTKINIFLGVPNPAADLLPPRLTFLKSYFRQAPINWFFPMSVTLATIATTWFAVRAGASSGADFESYGYVLIGTLSALGLIEHWFLVLPFRADALWRWGLVHQADATNTTVSKEQVISSTTHHERLRELTSTVVSRGA